MQLNRKLLPRGLTGPHADEHTVLHRPTRSGYSNVFDPVTALKDYLQLDEDNAKLKKRVCHTILLLLNLFTALSVFHAN